MKIKTGILAPNFQSIDVLGNYIKLKDYQGKKVYIAFLRNVNCAMCSLHLFNIIRVIDRLKANDLEIIVFFESSPEMFNDSYFFREQVLKEHKITIISDPNRKFYSLYGAEISPEKATLEVFQAAPGRMDQYQEALNQGFTGDGIQAGTHPDAIPADFLLNEQLIVKHLNYGQDTGDFTKLSLIESFSINPNSILN